MADGTGIEWTEATWNPLRGCTRKSPGCGGPGPHGGCYAESIAARFSDPGQAYHGLAVRTPSGGRWTGKVALAEHLLTLPMKWRKPRRIFVNSMSDLFHEAVPDEWIDRIFAVMALCPQHRFQVLTKRNDRMRRYFNELADGEEGSVGERIGFIASAIESLSDLGVPVPHDAWGPLQRWPLPNVWLGVSVEDQKRADERIPDLLATPAAVRFLSCEPLLGPVDLTRWMPPVHHHPDNSDRDSAAMQSLIKAARDRLGGGIDWIIAGGESGPKARPMHPDWARSLRDQCAATDTAFFFKQWGEWLPVFDRDVEDPDWKTCHRWAETHPKGRWLNLAGGHGFHGERVVYVDRVGKKKAGRLLDGVEHSAMPSASSASLREPHPAEVRG